jgi:hypothetical protein
MEGGASPGSRIPVATPGLFVDRDGRARFLKIQILHIILFAPFAWLNVAEAVAVSACLNLYLYFKLLRDEYRRNLWPMTPLFLYGLSSLLRIGVGSFYLIVVNLSGIEPVFGPVNVAEQVGLAHLLLMGGDWFLIAGYHYIASRSDRATDTIRAPRDACGTLVPLGIALIASSWLLEVAKADFNLDQFGSLAGLLQSAMFPAGFLLFCIGATAARSGVRAPLFVVAALLFTIEVALALRSYMKQDVIRTVLPLFVLFVIRLRSGGVRLGWFRISALVVAAYFMVMVVFPYNQMRRQLYAYNIDGTVVNNDVDVLPSLISAFESSIPGTSEFRERHVFPYEGFWTFFVRNQWTSAAAWSVGQVSTHSTNDYQGIQAGLTALVPRLFWPEKPPYWPGRELTVALGRARSAETATTSTGLGLAAALYWEGGIAALVMGMFIHGLLLAILWNITRSEILSNAFATILYFSVILESLRWFESVFDGGVQFYAYNFFVLVPLLLIWRRWFGRAAGDALDVAFRQD